MRCCPPTASVAALLEDPRGSALEGEIAAVEKWLRVWEGREVPLAEARAAWLDRSPTSSVGAANLLRKDDRMACCYFSLCGDVDVSPATTEGNGSMEKVSPGSVVMFARPQRLSRVYSDPRHENFLSTLTEDDLMQERLMQSKTFHTAGAVLARRRVEVLAAALHTNSVSIEVRSRAPTCTFTMHAQFLP